MNKEQIVVDLIALNGGSLVGRARFQHQAYLLDRGGAHFGLQFTYQRGPYSFDLIEGLTDARAYGRITIEEQPGLHGVPYATFKSEKESRCPKCFGKMPIERAKLLSKRINDVSDLVLALAATIVFLRDEWDYYGKGKISPVDETRIRKPLYATDDRIAQACTLIDDLGLSAKAARQ